MSQVTLDIVQGIAQAAANAYDGAKDSDGKPIEIGLKREDGHPIHSSRVMDGFKVRVEGGNCVVNYQADIKLRDVYATKFEDDLEQMMSSIVSFLKKEYKKITGKALKLTPAGDVDAVVQSTSRVRVFVNAKKIYKIGGMEDVVNRLDPSEDRLDDSFRKFLELGGLKNSK